MSFEFSKGNIDHYLYELAKEYKKLNRNNPKAEIILVGGSVVSIKYGFREATTDLDAIINAGSTMKEAIKKVADNNSFSVEWINQGFKNTKSYTPKLAECSKFYKIFCQCLTVRTVEDEYLIAMKLMSGRQYKYDLSDIIGICMELREKGVDINYDKVNKAVNYLYGSWDDISKEMNDFIKTILENNDLEELYYSARNNEKINRKAIDLAEEEYKDVIDSDNINSFISAFKEKAKEEIKGDDYTD